ncbi:GNAT family N-acetyltransferase [archaeon]|jgi:RimJ/RimL family protein N-acetyltransferase|nr:GNAT family N-acetyltransferase [archaeon]MBT4647224.1 GNAT family N-acetyltransferase [archaeon]MBT7392483.1 GNAT family N-acetyltransferase [archaeon]
MEKIKKLIGKNVYLGPVPKKNISKLVKWMNDLDVAMYTCQATRKHTIETSKKFQEECLNDMSIHYYGIFTNDGNLIGGLDLREIDSINRTASLGIIIGEKEYWDKGYGTESTKLLLDYGFNILNLNNIMLEVFDFNPRAIRVYEKCGFKIIGKRRKSKFFNGKYYDEIFMDILAKEFNNLKLKK